MPSIRTLSGYTGIVRKVKHSIGLSQIQGWTRPSRIKQKVKYRIGLYSPIMKFVRNTSKGRFPSYLGIFKKRK